MKKILLLLTAFLLTASMSRAQNSNAIFFTENGERFQVVLNGVLQNTNPETNVKLTGLTAPNYKCRIIFQDTKLGYVDYNLFFPEQGSEETFNVKKNNKGAYVVRWVSRVPVAQAPSQPATQAVVVYNATPPPATTTTVQHTTTATTTGTSDPNNVNFNMGINMGESGGNINMNMSGMDPNMNGSTSTTTTTTKTTTVSSSSSSSMNTNSEPVYSQPVQPVNYLPGYNGPIGCPIPMSQGDFQSAKGSISSKSFEESKLTMAKQILNNNCLLCSQVKEVMLLFSFEDSRLDYAKYAYGHTYDIGNYYKVNDAFTFESSIDDLNTYINGYKH